MKKLILFFMIFLAYSQLCAQDEENIFTDRPNATDAIALISPGTFQIEAGVLSQWNKEDGIKYNWITSPNLSIKYGIANWLEMRVLTNYLTLKAESETIEATTSGLTPITLSPKIKLIKQNFWIPAASLATNFTLPDTGKETFQTDKLNYGFRLLLEHVFNDKYSWSHGFGADWDDSRETTWAYSSSFATAVTGKLGAFVELYGYFATDITSSHNFDAGFTYLASHNLQLDTSFGLPLNENAPDFFISFGAAWKTNLKNENY
ncbi:hypothetical protein C900_04778 [Fulvivirga imtechensis AK7]|uniref:Transporter n=1 Tax=Fulvivirga imtechensis AK7 TaxID=1237149 RepID=L8K1F2_9BACT|nr:transporter [Fulvivirga imtechensis]ELR73267.1 hypothetical protein C900_04778 [Fulvivirga imtechensis AK7]